MSEKSKSIKLGYCDICGDSLWEGFEHKCEPVEGKVSLDGMNRLVSDMLRALVLSDMEFSGQPLEKGRAKAAIKRVLWQLNLDDSHLLFFKIQTTTEACPPASWD